MTSWSPPRGLEQESQAFGKWDRTCADRHVLTGEPLSRSTILCELVRVRCLFYDYDSNMGKNVVKHNTQKDRRVSESPKYRRFSA